MTADQIHEKPITIDMDAFENVKINLGTTMHQNIAINEAKVICHWYEQGKKRAAESFCAPPDHQAHGEGGKMSNESQKAFEKYAKSKHYNTEKLPDGGFRHDAESILFEGWNACVEHIRAKLQSDKMVEKVAIQLSKLQNSDDVVWDDMHKEKYQEKFLTVAKAAIAAVLEGI